ncbi:hypothetical protein C8F01DRAFT_585352 [Mycena amicta]|nr:hypothetical protein C8F01DRAFT_585352 [Mycena amicta]
MPARTIYHGGSPAFASSSTYPSPVAFSPPPPPRLNHTRYAPLPTVQEHKLHWALDAQSISSLRFNISRDPAVYITCSPPTLNSRVLAEVAIPLPCVTILVNRWRVPVYPSSRKAGATCTVADVLYAIYHSLAQPCSRQELAEIPQQLLDAARYTYYSRCRGLERIAAQSEPLRRIDFLGGKHTFSGLMSTSDSPDVWILGLS